MCAKKLNILVNTVLLAAAVPMAAWAGADDQNYGNAVVSEITSIYDADTFRVTIKRWPAIAGYRIPVRVAGIDAPEIKGKCEAERVAAQEAKQLTVGMLRAAKVVELRNLRRDKYFRLLADIYADNKSLSASLIEAGLARPYDGGTKSVWCN